MSQMQIDPQMIQALLSGQGGGMPQGAPPQEQDAPEEDWLTELINDAHKAMVAEKDPQIVSVLGAILNQLTTVQAKKAQQSGG